MSEALLRQWELLRAVPTAPKSVTVAELMSKLQEAGFTVVKRTVQRDLAELSAIFPLVSDVQNSAYGWSWSASSPAFDLPAMDGATALSVRLIEQFIQMLLPPALADQLHPQFARAQAVLAAIPGSRFGRWADIVRVVPGDMPLKAPPVDSKSVRAVYGALLSGKRFDARYRSRTSEPPDIRRYEVSPLGLVARGRLLYLVCTLWNYDDIRQLALHRLDDVNLLETPVMPPADFDLDRYIQDGEFQYPVGPSIVLKARFERDTVAHLAETPLSTDQHMEPINEQYVLLTATVPDSQQLEWWLMGLTPYVEVLEPAQLRDRLVARVAGARLLYAPDKVGVDRSMEELPERHEQE